MYTYHLRGGVRWHDGVPFTSRDVAFSWRAVMSPRNNVLHREGYDQVVRIDTPDDRTVVVHLKRRDPPFVTQFFTTLQEGGEAHRRRTARGAPEMNDVPFDARAGGPPGGLIGPGGTTDGASRSRPTNGTSRDARSSIASS